MTFWSVFFYFPLQHIHPLELMHNSLRDLPSVPEYKLDFKEKSPLEHYVQEGETEITVLYPGKSHPERCLAQLNNSQRTQTLQILGSERSVHSLKGQREKHQKGELLPSQRPHCQKTTCISDAFLFKKYQAATEIWEDLEQEIYKLNLN